MTAMTKAVDAKLLVDEARTYLLSFEGVTPALLDAHIFEWKREKRSTKAQLYRSMIGHAQNRRDMPNSIGDIDNLGPILFDFDPDRVLAGYADWKDFLRVLMNSGIKVPGRIEPHNARSHWTKYSKSVLSCASFLSSFDSAAAFHNFVASFNFNEYSKLALPLLLSEEIFGFGFALACDFLKENGYEQFLKPDTHINYICGALGITTATNDFGVFKDAIAYCESNGLVPYEFDKLLWLVGSGSFYQVKLQVKTDRRRFIARIQANGFS